MENVINYDKFKDNLKKAIASEIGVSAQDFKVEITELESEVTTQQNTDKLQQIIGKCQGEVAITINGHRSSYRSVADELEQFGIKPGVDIEPDIYNKMCELNHMIELQFYPHTPVGFCKVYHYDINQAILLALKILETK